MHVDLYVSLAGLIVGFVVGLTGMGGGALMTPVLVLLFHVQPLAAVSSDLVAAVIMKPVGGAVHAKRGTVNKGMVGWLCLGSVPAAFGGVLLLKSMGNSDQIQGHVKAFLGWALVLASATMVAKAIMTMRTRLRDQALGRASATGKPIVLRPVPTVLIGAFGGVIVGMTSVGSGSLIIVLLLLLYPTLRANDLVGTDLVQAVPLVFSAALGHLIFGDFKLGLTTSLLIGSIPGVYIGARVSAVAPGSLIRRALVIVLLASGLKLLDVPTATLGWILLGDGRPRSLRMAGLPGQGLRVRPEPPHRRDAARPGTRSSRTGPAHGLSHRFVALPRLRVIGTASGQRRVMTTFRVWAPEAKTVALLLDDGPREMNQAEDGWWSANAPAAGAGTDYAFAIDGSSDELPDPRSAWQPYGVHGRSRLVDHDAFTWTDSAWRGLPLDGSVLYELHVGTFTPEGTFDAAIAKLDHLVDLGIDAIELLPCNAFPGTRGWGYDGVDLFAVHDPYGGPEGLKRFVDAAHARSLGVIMDVVYNHLGPSGNYLARFGPYFTDSTTRRGVRRSIWMPRAATRSGVSCSTTR